MIEELSELVNDVDVDVEIHSKPEPESEESDNWVGESYKIVDDVDVDVEIQSEPELESGKSESDSSTSEDDTSHNIRPIRRKRKATVFTYDHLGVPMRR